MATYSDDFERADGALGSNWAPFGSQSSNLLEIASGKAVEESNPTQGYAKWDGAGTWGRHQKCTITLPAGTNNIYYAVCYRNETDGYYRLKNNIGSTGAILEYRNTSGSGDQIGSMSLSSGTSAGDTISLEVDDDGAGGTELKCYVNDVLEGTYTDSRVTSGVPGMSVSGSGTDGIEAWEAEDYAAPAADTTTVTVADVTNSPLANETGVAWYWQDTWAGGVVDSGTGASTNASGVMTVTLDNTVLSSGQSGYMTVELNDGSIGIGEDQVD